MKKISGAEAARILRKNPAALCFDLRAVMKATGLSEMELLAELQAGRLVASGMPDGEGGLTDIAINAKELLDWMVETKQGRACMDRRGAN